MRRISLWPGPPGVRRVLALGAHPDDIEIGCGGSILRLAEEHHELDVTWVVFTSTQEREREARASAELFLAGVRQKRILVKGFRDGFLPYQGAEVKDEFEALKQQVAPDIVFTHFREDRHQDHRTISDLTWNTWRNHLILEYEIPKYDGDFGAPNAFVTLSVATLERKIALVLEHFASQTGKHWLTADLLRGVARIRGMECVAPDAHAEAFYCRKVVF
ncbi:MAG TPA: PIG-L deacetylase family protein [Anaeromyxobacter sp.]|nr:PIG-L deacetylase family protein [Anaeromyxobacter sp.]